MGNPRSSGEASNDKRKKKKSVKKIRENGKSEIPRALASKDPAFRLQRGANSYGVQPLGNLFFATSVVNVRDIGLGSLRPLSDEILLDILSLVGAKDLGRLATVSKAFYVVVHQDSLWRSLVLEEFKGNFSFTGRWKNSYIATKYPPFAGPSHVPLKVRNIVFGTEVLSISGRICS